MMSKICIAIFGYIAFVAVAANTTTDLIAKESSTAIIAAASVEQTGSKNAGDTPSSSQKLENVKSQDQAAAAAIPLSAVNDLAAINAISTLNVMSGLNALSAFVNPANLALKQPASAPIAVVPPVATATAAATSAVSAVPAKLAVPKSAVNAASLADFQAVATPSVADLIAAPSEYIATHVASPMNSSIETNSTNIYFSDIQEFIAPEQDIDYSVNYEEDNE